MNQQEKDKFIAELKAGVEMLEAAKRFDEKAGTRITPAIMSLCLLMGECQQR